MCWESIPIYYIKLPHTEKKKLAAHMGVCMENFSDGWALLQKFPVYVFLWFGYQ